MAALSFSPHPFVIAAICIAVLMYPLVCSLDGQRQMLLSRFRNGWKQASKRNLRFFFFGILAIFLAGFWPIADLAQHDLLIARLLQQLLVTLAAAPLLLLSIPRRSIVILTQPKLVDAILTSATRPAPAVLIFTTAAIAAMTPAGVTFETSSWWAQQLVHIVLLAAGVIAWIPILRIMPGVRQLTTAGKLAYLFVLSLLPNVPAIVLIFAKRPLYSVYAHSWLGLGAVADQQLTGAAAKVISLGVFWGVAISVLLRADRDEEMGLDPDPITWDDVRRELDRSAKRFPKD